MSSATQLSTKTVLTATLLTISSVSYSGVPINLSNLSEAPCYANIAQNTLVGTDSVFENQFNTTPSASDSIVLKSPKHNDITAFTYKTKIAKENKQPKPLGSGYLVPEV